MKAAKGPHGVYNENYTAAMKNPPGERLDLYTLCMYLQIEYIPPANRLPWSRWHCMPLMLGRHGKEAVGDYISNPEVHSSFSLFYNLRLHVSKTFTSCELDLTQPWRLKLYSARKKKGFTCSPSLCHLFVSHLNLPNPHMKWTILFSSCCEPGEAVAGIIIWPVNWPTSIWKTMSSF